MVELAKSTGMVLVVPVYEEEQPGVYYNTATVIDADAVEVHGCTPDQARDIQVRAADSVKRAVGLDFEAGTGARRLSSRLALQTLELKTVWHPVGA